jgi:phosphoglycerate dehydrogenase-like enzyme
MPKVIVELNSRIHSFQLEERHQRRLRLINPRVQWVFLQHPKQIAEQVSDAIGGLLWSFKTACYEQSQKLEWLITPAAGRDWMEPDPNATVKVMHSRFHGQIIAESFLSMLLQANQKQRFVDADRRNRIWNANGTWPRRLLRGQKILMLGYGNIARHCAEVCEGFGMEVTACSRRKKDDERPWLDATQIIGELQAFDHVLNLLPNSPETKAWFGRRHFEAMKVGSHFFNFGRGPTVDEDALIWALESGPLAGAGLDVTVNEPLEASSPLWDMDQVVLTPHSSCCYENYLDLFLDEWQDFLGAL